LLTLVVARNGDINVSQRRIGVAESNGWDVNVSRFSDWLKKWINLEFKIFDNDKF
jgi:hypothetical protein